MRSGTTYLNSSAGPGLPTGTRTMQTPKKAVKAPQRIALSDPMAGAAIPGTSSKVILLLPSAYLVDSAYRNG